MNEEQYFSDRLNNQIDWYDTKSKINKKLFYIFKIIQTVCTSLTPVLIGILLKWHWIIYVISILSFISILCEAILNLFKFNENWIQYRNTSESLKHEKFMYLSNSGTYDNSELDTFKTLVERTETLVSSENINWANMNLNYKGSENNNDKS